MSRKVISLFCGAGGCSLGFQQSGYDIIYATDIDEIAVKTYSLNFRHTLCECWDIRAIDFESLMKRLKLSSGELDFLIGGPPCQGFSSAGTRFWEDPRNLLLKSYADALETIKPKWFLMENVEGLLTANHGEYLSEIVKIFIDLGYQIQIEKVYAHEYGIPQRRKRVFIVGNNLGIPFRFPVLTSSAKGRIFRHAERTLRDAIGTLPPTSHHEASLSYNCPTTEQFEKYLRSSSRCVTEHLAPVLSELQMARIRCLAPGQTMKNIPEHLQHDSFRRRANRRVQDGTPAEKRGGSPSGLKRLIYDEPCLTITGSATREFIHPEADRPLTLRECARIQTFPDDFLFCGNSAEKIKMIGNAIPPLLARRFAEHLLDTCGFVGIPQQKGGLLSFSLTKAEAMSPALEKTKKILSSHMMPQQQKYFEL